MSSTISAPQANKSFGVRHPIAKRLIQVAAQYILIGIVLFASAGTPDWIWAWVYLATYVAIIVVNAFVMPRELIAERGAHKENVKPSDKWIAIAMMVFGIAVYLIAGLDERFSGSPDMSLALHLLGLVAFVFGNLLFTYAMTSNKFFSTAVRIQSERGQTVAASGPYRFLRHPGYVGYIV